MSKRSSSSRAEYLATIARLQAAQFEPRDPGTGLQPGVIYIANESRFNENFLSEPLTDYAVDWRDPNNIEATVDFFAPRVTVSPFFEYLEHSNAEEYYSDGDDDLRPIGGDYKRVTQYTAKPIVAKTEDRGLTIVIDTRTKRGQKDWKNKVIAKLIRRVHRNRLRRAVGLLSAAAVNTAKTWDTTAGKDPDQEMINEGVLARTASGVGFNRIGVGDTAWSKRQLAHRAQNSSGGFASAVMTEAQVAALVGVDRLLVSKERYQVNPTTKAEIVSNKVLMFNAMDGADTEDASNIKTFVSEYEEGGFFRIFEQQISANLVAFTVSYEELQKITSTLGIRQFTIS